MRFMGSIHLFKGERRILSVLQLTDFADLHGSILLTNAHDFVTICKIRSFMFFTQPPPYNSTDTPTRICRGGR